MQKEKLRPSLQRKLSNRNFIENSNSPRFGDLLSSTRAIFLNEKSCGTHNLRIRVYRIKLIKLAIRAEEAYNQDIN